MAGTEIQKKGGGQRSDFFSYGLADNSTEEIRGGGDLTI